jgi:hypothetical protein
LTIRNVEVDVLTAYPLAIATLAVLSHLTTFSGPSLLPLLPIAVPGFMPMPDWLGDAVRMLFDSDFYRDAAMRLL